MLVVKQHSFKGLPGLGDQFPGRYTTQLSAGRLSSSLCGAIHRVAYCHYDIVANFLRVSNLRARTRRKPQYILVLEVTSFYFHHILFVGSESLRMANIQGEKK